jgi:hypothetical protein
MESFTRNTNRAPVTVRMKVVCIRTETPKYTREYRITREHVAAFQRNRIKLHEQAEALRKALLIGDVEPSGINVLQELAMSGLFRSAR